MEEFDDPKISTKDMRLRSTDLNEAYLELEQLDSKRITEFKNQKL
jgi:hypothetical protein